MANGQNPEVKLYVGREDVLKLVDLASLGDGKVFYVMDQAYSDGYRHVIPSGFATTQFLRQKAARGLDTTRITVYTPEAFAKISASRKWNERAAA